MTTAASCTTALLLQERGRCIVVWIHPTQDSRVALIHTTMGQAPTPANEKSQNYDRESPTKCIFQTCERGD